MILNGFVVLVKHLWVLIRHLILERCSSPLFFYKHLAIVMSVSSDYPITKGLFFHGSSTLSSFTSFLSSVAAVLPDHGATIENLTIGSDDETSNRIAIKLFLPQSHNVLCTRHLRENVAAYLKDKVGLKPSSK